jgi:16S rRNA (uracil1498-N3)-methyltransferase
MASLLRLHLDQTLTAGTELELPAGAVRHVQVRRLQPGDTLHVFDGRGQACEARLLRMGRQSAAIEVGAPVAVLPELPIRVTLALGVPANERMDSLVEKATELGVARIQPLLTERSVLRLSGERAQRRVAHWLGIAAAAAEQCGRSTVPEIATWASMADWLARAAAGPAADQRWVLSPGTSATQGLRQQALPGAGGGLCVLSGPEGGLTTAEERAAQDAGFEPVSLGSRVLRADTAPLVVIAWLGQQL